MARTEITGSQIKDYSVDLAVDVTGILPVANGGTGSNLLALNNVLLGNGTGALQAVAPGAAGNVLTSNGTTWVSSPPTGGGGAGDVTLDGTQTLTNKTLTNPRVNAILDTNGATNISIGALPSAVNYFQVNNSSSGNSVNLYALGADTNISLDLNPKGTGSVTVSNVPVVTTTGTQSLTNKTLTSPRINEILDASGAVALSVSTTAGGNNYLQVCNALDNWVGFQAWGANATVPIYLYPKGTGQVTVYSPTGTSSLTADGTDNQVLNLVSKGTGAVQANGVPVVTTSGTQTLTNKDLSSGTNTFPSSLVTLTGSQTLSNKTLTAPALTGTTRAATGSIFELYGTADQTTNFEKLSLSYSGGYALVSADNGGTGAARTLRLRGGNGRRIDIGGTGITNAFVECPDGTSGSNITGFRLNNGTWSATSGVNNIIAITPTINQSSTAGYAALHINPSETATGSGVKRLISAQLGGSDRFVVDNTGLANAVGGFQANGVAVPTISSASTLTNKTLDLASNTITGTVEQFNAALSDGDFVTRDSNGNVTADAFISNTGSINFTANNQSLTLTADSPSVITVSASGTYSNCAINLPTSGMVPGRQFYIIGTSTIGGGCQVRVAGTGIQDFYGAYGMIFTALKASPTAPGDWLVLGQIYNPSSSGFLTTNGNSQTLVNKSISGLNNTLSNIAQSSVTNLTTDLAGKEPAITAGTTGQYWRGDKSWATLDKSAVGLSSVDNTADLSKPVSTATQTALDGKVSTTAVGAANGVASLDTNGKVPGSQLPNSIMTYQGLHDVSANSPALTDAGGSAGQVYRVSVAGSRNYGSGSISLDVGDYLIHSGTVWQKADTTDAVASVNGYTGNITLTQDDVASGTTNKVFTATEQTKLAGIATGATANSPDATLLDRANHTGTQAALTISDFSTAADARIAAAVGTTVQGYDSDLAAFAGKTAPTGDVVGTSDTQTLSGKTISGASNTLSNIGLSSLSTTGTASGSTYLRGDGVWSTISNGTFADTAFTLQDDGDATKQAKFQLSGLSTATTRTYTIPDASTTLVGTDTTQTLTGKTISGSSNTLSGIGLSSLSTTGTASGTTYLRGDGAWAELTIPELSSYSAVIGDGTSTSITVTHNLNTRNVIVSVKKTSNYAEVDCDVAATTANTVTLTFATAPTPNQYRVTVVGDSLVIPTVVAVLDGGTATGSTEDIIDGGTA